VAGRGGKGKGEMGSEEGKGEGGSQTEEIREGELDLDICPGGPEFLVTPLYVRW